MSLDDDLGVDPGASTAAINAAFRRKSKAAHPDHAGDPEEFKRLSCAVAILRDPGKRAEYDSTGNQDFGEAAEQAQVAEALRQYFGQALQSAGDPASCDPVGIAARLIAEQIAAQHRERATAAHHRRRLEDAQQRLRHNGSGQNILADMLAAQLAALDRNLAEMDRRAELLGKARALAADYDWTLDPPPTWAPPPMPTYTIFSNRGTI